MNERTPEWMKELEHNPYEKVKHYRALIIDVKMEIYLWTLLVFAIIISDLFKILKSDIHF